MSWDKWMKNRITNADELFEIVDCTEDEQKLLRSILEQFPMSVPKYYFDLIDLNDPDDPIRKMCLPSAAEANMTGSFDTSGEGDNTVITGTQHKYRETALILSTSSCAMYCRHCFRKRLVGLSDKEVLSHFEELIGYIRTHEEISNVLISGGDAFLNSNENIERFLEVLCEIGHLDFIRFGTRTPVVLPARIYEDEELLNILEKYGKKKQLYVVTQFNHPRELTAESKRAVDALLSRGVGFKNQTVLLKGVNDKPETLAELMRGLTAFGIAPYYVFQCRPVSGVGTQFQVPLREGYKIIDQAKGRLNGPAKCFRYAMSHPTGKIEILGSLGGNEMLFKYHQAKYDKDSARIFTAPVADGQAWLDSIPE